MLLLLTMVGAALGAPARWLLDEYVQGRHRSTFPWGTLLINVLGSLVFGALVSAAALERASAPTIALLGAGLCGGFTTFSTFGYETVRLAQQGATRQAVLNAGLSVVLGLGASLAGWWAVQALA